MTVTTNDAKTGPYNGDGSTTNFTYDFLVLAETHIVVTLQDSDGVETVQVLNTDYTVSGVGEPAGGTVTMTTAPASGEQLTITRDTTIDQEVDLQNRGSFFPETIEDAFDKLTLIAQEQADQLGRLVKLPVSESADLTLPTLANRSGKLFGFDDSGEPVARTVAELSASLDVDVTSVADTQYLRYSTSTGAWENVTPVTDDVEHTSKYANAPNLNLKNWLDRELSARHFLTSSDWTVDQSGPLKDMFFEAFENDVQAIDLNGAMIGLDTDIKLRCGTDGFTSLPSVERNREKVIKNGKLLWLGGDSANATSEYMIDIGCPSSVVSESAFSEFRFKDIVFDGRGNAKNLVQFFNFYNLYFQGCQFIDYDDGRAVFLPNADDGGTSTNDNSPNFYLSRFADLTTADGWNGNPIVSYAGDFHILRCFFEWTGALDMHVGSGCVEGCHFSYGSGAATEIRLGAVFRDPRQIRYINNDHDNAYVLFTNVGFNSPLAHNAATNFRSIEVAFNDFNSNLLAPTDRGLVTFETENANTDLREVDIAHNSPEINGQGADAVEFLRVVTTGSGSWDFVEANYLYKDGFGVAPGGDGVIEAPGDGTTNVGVSSGSNADGRWVRFGDGTQICTGTVTFTQAAAGRLTVRWDFPKAFLSGTIPTVEVPALDGDTASLTPSFGDLGPLVADDVVATRVDWTQYLATGGTGFGASDTIDAYIKATGRWK